MMKRLFAFAVGMSLATVSVSQETTTPPKPEGETVDVLSLDEDISGPRSQVLVLGSMHLSDLPETFDTASLEPILRRLAVFKPDIITIEAISGEGCDHLTRYEARYPGAAKGYCADTLAARTATGLDVPAALVEIEKTLDTWPSAPTAAQRRRLASLFLAGNDPASALVQWWQLPEAGRTSGDGIDQALLERLQALEQRRNESYMIAARLAARLGLQRVHAVDDHTGDGGVRVDDEAAYGKAIQAAWDNPQLKALITRFAETRATGDMLASFRLLNSKQNLAAGAAADFGAALREPSSQHYGRVYVAGWETRNLRMVANIRATFAARPGARVLVIVGASHKSWFDSLLGQMQGVEIVDAEQLLE